MTTPDNLHNPANGVETSQGTGIPTVETTSAVEAIEPDATGAIGSRGRMWLGRGLFALSVAGLPLSVLALRHLGRAGGVLLEAASALLFARAVQFIIAGTPARLRTFPRLLVYAELAADGLAAISGLWVWVLWPFDVPGSSARRRQRGTARWVGRLNALAVAATFVLHATRMAIYLSLDQGRRDQAAVRDRPSDRGPSLPREIAVGVYWLPVRGSNVYFVQSGSAWVLIDAAWANCARSIQRAAEARFGANARPAAILLTHVHPDHAGSALDLARRWRCPVYVHPDELALATARELSAIEQYANPLDRWIILPLLRAMGRRRVESMLAKTSLEDIARAFDPGGDVPGLPDWACVPTPGHSPGHVAFFREGDRVLITGDAILTVDVNSIRGLLSWGLRVNQPRVAGAPWYTNWNRQAGEASIAALARLEPRVLASGHGTPMTGAGTARELQAFAERFSHPGQTGGRDENVGCHPGGSPHV